MVNSRQGTTIFTAICCFVGTLAMIQLWLLSASVEALALADTSVELGVAMASTLLAGANGALLLHGLAFDRRLRQAGRPRD